MRVEVDGRSGGCLLLMLGCLQPFGQEAKLNHITITDDMREEEKQRHTVLVLEFFRRELTVSGAGKGREEAGGSLYANKAYT